MRMYDILEKKKNNLELNEEEINYVIENYTNGNIPDYQMSSLLMAICINGMNDNELKFLTLAMANSGERLDLSGINGNTVDKHSTGGVGDKTTLIVGPIVACLNCKVAKMSGRALGHTGGTIDKLESIEGFKTKLIKEEFINQVNEINISVISQTSNIAPADKKIYALRDVTATVQSIPLIASSIMSKKIASGAKNLVLDVKVGSGAFMKNEKDAKELGRKMVDIGKMLGIDTVAIITNMDVPLGNNIGNSLEVEEAIKVLNNENIKDLREICIALSTVMNSISNNISFEESKKQVEEVLNSGEAYNKFKEFIECQGGKIEFNKSKYKLEIYSNEEGYISSMDTESIGKISGMIGAGRINKEDEIDYTAGIVLNKKVGDLVNKNDLLATLYSSTKEDLKQYKEDYLNCINFSEEKAKVKPLIIDIIK